MLEEWGELSNFAAGKCSCNEPENSKEKSVLLWRRDRCRTALGDSDGAPVGHCCQSVASGGDGFRVRRIVSACGGQPGDAMPDLQAEPVCDGA